MFGCIRASFDICGMLKSKTLYLSAEVYCVCKKTCVLGFSLTKQKGVCSAVVRLIKSALWGFLLVA